MDVRRALIVTNRPAIANSWYDDFQRFIGHQTTYQFVSESSSLSERSPMTREQWRAYSAQNVDADPRIIEFVSLQDIKGSQYFGGNYPKLKHIAEMDWDLLIIDEAHEGIDTTKTDIAFEQIKRSHTLHLSGTPFKALASGRFSRGPDLQLDLRRRADRPRRVVGRLAGQPVRLVADAQPAHLPAVAHGRRPPR